MLFLLIILSVGCNHRARCSYSWGQ